MAKPVSVVSRRALITMAAAGSVAVSGELLMPVAAQGAVAQGADEGEQEVGAVEDLMREHGVLRRALIVFREVAGRLREGVDVDPAALGDTASLFREFGEAYHERMLEERYIFPALRAAGGPAAALVDVLVAQHRRGGEITRFVAASAGRGSIPVARRQPLAETLEAMARMYEAHAAREDTVIFPAWKATMSDHQLEELGERFEDIEHRQFGADGFEDAVRRMDRIERTLGLAELSAFTARSPG